MGIKMFDAQYYSELIETAKAYSDLGYLMIDSPDELMEFIEEGCELVELSILIIESF